MRNCEALGPVWGRMVIWFVLAVGGVGLVGCNRPEAPDCLQSAGDLDSLEQELEEGSLGHLTVYDRLDVRWHAAPSETPVRLVFSGPRNLLPDIQVGWTGGEGGALELADGNRCRWVRDLGIRLRVDVYAHDLASIELRGSGTFEMDPCIRSGTLEVDTRQFSGEARIDAEVDTLRLRMHAGPGTLIGTGTARYLGIFVAGLGAVDARAVEAARAQVNQSGIRDLHFRARDYAYVGHYGPGAVLGHGGPPDDWDWFQTSSGDLTWLD